MRAGSLAVLWLVALCRLGSPERSADKRPDQVKAEERKSIPGMAAIESPDRVFAIDRYEVSEPEPGHFLSIRNVPPRTSISRSEAAEVCARYGKRLCTRHEWQNACLGTQRRRFAYGQAAVPGRCNLSGRAPLATGQKTDCVTDGGAFDMPGNVMEWVSDDDGGRGVVLGGSFRSGDGTDCFTEHYLPSETRNEQVGFRCCL